MKTYHVYRVDTGEFIGRSLTCFESDLALNLAEGEGAVDGVSDWLSERVDLVTDDYGVQQPIVRDWQPPAPPADELRTWSWDASERRWRAAPTFAARCAAARAERDRRMQACDWVTLRAMRTGQPIPAAWAVYMQLLADVTQQPGFPDAIDWPVPPSP